MHEKVILFLENAKQSENKNRDRILTELGLVEKEYAPIKCKCTGIITTGINKNAEVSFVEENRALKLGDIVSGVYMGNNEKIKLTNIEYIEYNVDEYPEIEYLDNSICHYRTKPIIITDEEYAQILKTPQAKELLNEENSVYTSINTSGNGISTGLTVLAVIIFIIGFIAGLIMYNSMTIIIWLVSLLNGMLLLAISKIISLLEDIKRK